MSCRYRHRMWCNCKKPAKPFPPIGGYGEEERKHLGIIYLYPPENDDWNNDNRNDSPIDDGPIDDGEQL